jgi:hypothetical protein
MVKISISQQGFRRLYNDWFDAERSNPSMNDWIREELGASCSSSYNPNLTDVSIWYFTFEREQEALLFALRYS